MPNPLYLTSQEAEAILRLEDNPDYQVLVEHLHRRRTELLEKMARARDSTELRILQGKAQELSDLMQLSLRSRTFSSLPASRSPLPVKAKTISSFTGRGRRAAGSENA